MNVAAKLDRILANPQQTLKPLSLYTWAWVVNKVLKRNPSQTNNRTKQKQLFSRPTKFDIKKPSYSDTTASQIYKGITTISNSIQTSVVSIQIIRVWKRKNRVIANITRNNKPFPYLLAVSVLTLIKTLLYRTLKRRPTLVS